MKNRCWTQGYTPHSYLMDRPQRFLTILHQSLYPIIVTHMATSLCYSNRLWITSKHAKLSIRVRATLLAITERLISGRPQKVGNCSPSGPVGLLHGKYLVTPGNTSPRKLNNMLMVTAQYQIQNLSGGPPKPLTNGIILLLRSSKSTGTEHKSMVSILPNQQRKNGSWIGRMGKLYGWINFTRK